jgi:DNA-binding transcriptional ArsR family regulator
MHPSIPGARFGIASFGELVADPSRVAMLLSLMDGLARPASELARIAGITPSTASSHLGRLVGGGLVRADPVGRHRYFRLASDRVAEALEVIALGTSACERLAPPDSPRAALSLARTCYKHLAGDLGVAWFASLEQRRLLRIHEGALTLAPPGIECFEGLGMPVSLWPSGKPCLDWTARRNHLGGGLGALLTQHLLELRWVARKKEGRALRVTTLGRSGFSRFGIPDSLLESAS